MKEKVDTRQFSVSPHIIYSLIKAQAGTLAKGILECIMNSVDAGATQIDVVLKPTSLQVTDNGKGFSSRAEIEACFEVFGFEHEEGAREYGKFGIGRAQLWNFCSTVWHTNGFQMDVDIKNKGLDYNLSEGVSPFAGLRIDGKFYEPLVSSEILACERELKELAKYVHVPVTFNGERFSTEPMQQKWTHETDDAWVQVNNVSTSLVVYNLGVKVREYPASYFGLGGLVVTKPGVRLSLNMARNDILLAECQVWKRIKPFLQRKSDEDTKRSTRLSEVQLTNLAVRFISGDIGYGHIAERKLIQDVVGKKHTIAEFFERALRTTDKAVTFTGRGEASPVAEETHKRGDCLVLSYQSLQRFEVRTMGEFVKRLASAIEKSDPFAYRQLFWSREGSRLEQLTVVEKWKQACTRVRQGFTEVPHKEWTKREQAAMSALGARGSYQFLSLLNGADATETTITERELRIGVSEVAEAWTDGQRVITLNRAMLARMDGGLAGIMHVVSVIVHEYLHEGPSTDTHVHDEDFYERFHRVVTYYPQNYGTTIGDIASNIMASYAKECSRRGVPIKARIVAGIDRVEAYAITE